MDNELKKNQDLETLSEMINKFFPYHLRAGAIEMIKALKVPCGTR